MWAIEAGSLEAAKAAAKNKAVATKAKEKVAKAGAVRARVPPRAGMQFRGYRKRDPQWTDAVYRNLKFKAGGGKMLAEDSEGNKVELFTCLLYTSPSPRDRQKSRMPSSA